jgi:hypothetical protein
MCELIENQSVAGWIAYLYIASIGFKCFFVLWSRYVNVTAGLQDNERFKKVVASDWYNVLSFILDLTLRIKLPKG